MPFGLYYTEKGFGTPLVLLHGNGENGEYFKNQIDYFAKKYRVIAVDTRGHGKSPRGNKPFRLETFADDLKSFLDENNLKRDINFANLQLQIQYEKDMAAYNKRVIEQYENHRIIIHDIKKHLISISLLNQKQDYEAIDRYLSNLLQSADLQENLQVSDQPFLNSLLLRYKQECTKQKISFFTDIRSGVISFLNESDLTSLLCNLLDNAMEAACDIPGAFIELRIEKRENTNITLIVLVNSSRINPLLPDNSLLRSHKEPSLFHGLGMKSVRRVLDKYHGDITYHYDTSNNTFHTVLCVMEND